MKSHYLLSLLSLFASISHADDSSKVYTTQDALNTPKEAETMMRHNAALLRSYIHAKAGQSMSQSIINSPYSTQIAQVNGAIIVNGKVIKTGGARNVMINNGVVTVDGKVVEGDASQTNTDQDKKISFQDAYLAKAQLRGLDLFRTNLTQANLSNADLKGSNFDRVNFEKAELKGVYLQGSYFDRVSFERADLTDANLRGSDFDRVNFEHAKLENANLCGSNFDRVNFEQANLKNADLRGSNLDKVDFTNANLTDTNLTNACLSRVTLKNAQLSNAQRYSDPEQNRDWLTVIEGLGAKIGK